MKIGILFEEAIIKKNKIFPNKWKLISCSNKIIKILKNDGYQIVIINNEENINSNDENGHTLRLLTELFLIDNDIPYDEIIFTDDVLKECHDDNIDILITTNTDSLVLLMNDIKYTVKDWIDMYIKLFELNPKKELKKVNI